MNYEGILEDKDGNKFYPKTVTRITTGEEYETGRIIDGKIEYCKRLNIGKLPDAGKYTLDMGLGNVTFWDFKGVAVLNRYSYKMDTRKISDYSVTVSVENGILTVQTFNSAYINYTGYVEVYYTKN